MTGFIDKVYLSENLEIATLLHERRKSKVGKPVEGGINHHGRQASTGAEKHAQGKAGIHASPKAATFKRNT